MQYSPEKKLIKAPIEFLIQWHVCHPSNFSLRPIQMELFFMNFVYSILLQRKILFHIIHASYTYAWHVFIWFLFNLLYKVKNFSFFFCCNPHADRYTSFKISIFTFKFIKCFFFFFAINDSFKMNIRYNYMHSGRAKCLLPFIPLYCEKEKKSTIIIVVIVFFSLSYSICSTILLYKFCSVSPSTTY